MFQIRGFEMSYQRTITQFLGLTMALVVLGTPCFAAGLQTGCRCDPRVNAVGFVFSCTNCNQDACILDRSDRERSPFPTCPACAEQYPALALTSANGDSKGIGLPKICCPKPVDIFLSNRSSQPKTIYPQHCSSGTKEIVNCAILF